MLQNLLYLYGDLLLAHVSAKASSIIQPDLMFQAYCTMSLRDNISVSAKLQLNLSDSNVMISDPIQHVLRDQDFVATHGHYVCFCSLQPQMQMLNTCKTWAKRKAPKRHEVQYNQTCHTVNSASATRVLTLLKAQKSDQEN